MVAVAQTPGVGESYNPRLARLCSDDGRITFRGGPGDLFGQPVGCSDKEDAPARVCATATMRSGTRRPSTADLQRAAPSASCLQKSDTHRDALGPQRALTQPAGEAALLQRLEPCLKRVLAETAVTAALDARDASGPSLRPYPILRHAKSVGNLLSG